MLLAYKYVGFLSKIYYVKNIKSFQWKIIIQGFQYALKPLTFFLIWYHRSNKKKMQLKLVFSILPNGFLAHKAIQIE